MPRGRFWRARAKADGRRKESVMEDQKLPEDKKLQREARRLQPFFREAATFAGLHLACRLPKCRRAKRCTGCWPAEEIATTHYKKFPPCVMSNETQSALNHATRVLGERQRQDYLAAGYTQEDFDRWEAEEEAEVEAEERAEALALSRASRKGR